MGAVTLVSFQDCRIRPLCQVDILEHLVRLELTHTAWKAVVLATNTKDAYKSKIFIFLQGNLEWSGLYFILMRYSNNFLLAPFLYGFQL